MPLRARGAAWPRARGARWRPAGGVVKAVLVVCAALAAAGAGAPPEAGVREQLREVQVALLPEAVMALAGLDWGAGGFVTPVEGRVSSPFGWRNVSVNGNRYHGGLDIAANMGTPVVAARSGVVTRAGWWGSYGNVVVLDHGDGTETRYAHLSAVTVRVGQGLRQGDVLGRVGSTGASTGPHLHFEVRFDGRAVDPLPYLQGWR